MFFSPKENVKNTFLQSKWLICFKNSHFFPTPLLHFSLEGWYTLMEFLPRWQAVKKKNLEENQMNSRNILSAFCRQIPGKLISTQAEYPKGTLTPASMIEAGGNNDSTGHGEIARKSCLLF